MYVFRESQRAAPARRLLAELADSIRRAASSSDPDALLDALLRAGELECSLADSGQQDGADRLAGLTDCLAAALVRGDRLAMGESCLQILGTIQLSGEMSLRTPEGFAYYALHPLDYMRTGERFLTESRVDSAAVIGIRTIGTTLSAVVAATFRQHRAPASRITVRPVGHPFERECVFSDDQKEWIGEHQHARFFVVDEGPGLSGSSFLSVALALENEGIPGGQITFFCNHLPYVDSLRSPRSRVQWSKYEARAATLDENGPPGEDFSFGAWKKQVFGSDQEIPSSWTQMERRKFLDGDQFLKCEGLGKYGDAAFERASKLAAMTYAPLAIGRSQGYTRYEWIEGTPVRKDDLNESLAQRMAEYCAFRGAEFVSEGYVQEAVDLESMTRVNLLEEFASDEVSCDLSVLRGSKKIISDSRMQPHYWVRATSGDILKTSGNLHGDDHLFPGPCDIAWDLAGAIVEWEMGECVASHFLSLYQRFSGDDTRVRIGAFVVAYSAFRMGYCKMAAEAMAGSDEELRLRQDFLKYRGLLVQKLRTPRNIAGPTIAQPRTAVPHNQAA